MEANEMRREKVKQECIEITKANEKPFTFWTRDLAKMAEKKVASPEVNAECRRA